MSDNFFAFIQNLLNRMNLSELQLSALTTARALEIYKIAFTHSTKDVVELREKLIPSSCTYEIYEQIGDALIRSFMVNYFYRRFPRLWEDDTGVKIVARLVIKYGSKEVLSSMAEYYNFWPFIQTVAEITSINRKLSILEDVFEAFIGATSIIMDRHQHSIVGPGFITCYSILEVMFDKLEISLDYESLFDSKTRLKELVDFFKEKMGAINYIYSRDGQLSKVIIEYNGVMTIGEGIDSVKAKAEQHAAKQALEVLKSLGFERRMPNKFQDA